MKIDLPNTFDVITTFEECLRIEDVLRVTLQKAAPYGVDHVLVGVIPEKNLSHSEQLEHVIFGRVPNEWVGRYFSNNYLEIDPTIDHIRSSNNILNWKSVSSGGADANRVRVMNEAREFGMFEGITIPHMSLDGVRIGASFSGERMADTPESRTFLNVLSAMALMRAFSLFKKGQKDTLTPRERECLLWVAEGKSDWDISTILGISQKTVEKHLSNCRSKLNAVNRSQAVVRAMQSGIIN